MASGLFNLKQVNQAISQGAWSGYIAPKWVEYLVVAGGGSGGIEVSSNVGGGGGGAGGLLTGIATVTAGTSYTVTVGAGGAAVSASTTGNTGVASVFGVISTSGGGGGASTGVGNNALSGGSGGGGANQQADGSTYPNGTPGNGISGQGNAGGAGYGNGSSALYGPSGGGGGAGTIGLTGLATVAGNGGAGIASAITGTVVTYAGGGGGSHTSSSTAGTGGVGGGGAGGAGASGTNGSANTGGGGGAMGRNGSTSGAGGSGIVVVRYPGSIQFFTGGTLSYANGYMIHTFYASGTLAPTTPTPYVTAYQISRSLRFNSPDSAYLNRTPATTTNRRTFTFSAWVKLSKTSDDPFLMGAGAGGQIWLNGDKIRVRLNGSPDYYYDTSAVFRDYSAWYHIVVGVDTTNATSTDRVKIYVNGTQQAIGASSAPPQNYDTEFNLASTGNNLGKWPSGSQYLNGYMTEINFIDGQALTPSSFGYTNPATGVWSPLAFVGTYGTNGFYLNFSDNSNTTAATLGKDYSGNGNNWTPNNFSVTAGAGNDSLVDSPTSYGTDTGVGGEVRGNYATWNPLFTGSRFTLANGNLDMSETGGDTKALSTIGMSSGKWYCEITPSGNKIVGLSTIAGSTTTSVGYDAYSWGYVQDGTKVTNSSATSYGATYANGDVIGIAFDADAGTLVFYKNGSSQGTAYTGLTSGPYFFAAGNGTTTYTANFGQRPFAYTAPSGFKALCTQNLPTPTIGATATTLATKYFNPVLYTGNSAANTSITGVGFQPDFVWLKCRSTGAQYHNIVDSVRGATGSVMNTLYTNATLVEATTNSSNYTSYGYVTSLNSDGFTVTNGSNGYDQVNLSGSTYVAWNWKANGSGSTNTSGSITSTVSANTTSGFSVVTYTGTGANATVGHGLGVAPSIIFFKNRSAVTNWVVYNINATSAAASARPMYLNTANGEIANGAMFNYPSTNSSTIFNIGTDSTTNGSGNLMVAYCFTPIAGYFATNIFTGNGSADGPFVYCGFRPAYVLIKDTTNNGDWFVWDTARDTYNVSQYTLLPNSSAAETSGSANYIDILSNGFKVKATTAGFNGSTDKFLFMAFASAPFKFSLAR